ncbi:RelA/SpoT domain-containing protein [Photobacterium alginatilyticum]|uniref:Phosphoribosylglycinamide formyltransferase n=1 Tax=Photobacterium alginatilyticum TaxID=1775171 RepID=A0ABW9YLM3_9GAMM|nr:RelA/SpoT domain-containing protein [Photobacterium alginatilyticum]NBI54108.1 phosphoribosylglycinamide formyltransferase [Photobacterium alginatilyticum]
MVAKSLLRTCFVLMFVLGRSPVASAALPEYNNADIENPSPVQGSKETFQRSLSGLYSIPSYRSPTLIQPHSDFDALYQQAASAQSELEDVLSQVSLLTAAQPVLPGLKSKARAQQKIATELEGQTELLTDLARGSLVTNNIGSLVQSFELLNKEVTVVEVKNRFKTPAPSGYRDLKLLVRLPKTQHIAEIQLHLEEISVIKNGAEHEIYEQIQTIERKATTEQRDLNDIELAKLASLRQQSRAMYQTAWHQYLQPEAIAS